MGGGSGGSGASSQPAASFLRRVEGVVLVEAFQKAQGAGAKMEGYAARAASSRPVGHPGAPGATMGTMPRNHMAWHR